MYSRQRTNQAAEGMMRPRDRWNRVLLRMTNHKLPAVHAEQGGFEGRELAEPLLEAYILET